VLTTTGDLAYPTAADEGPYAGALWSSQKGSFVNMSVQTTVPCAVSVKRRMPPFFTRPKVQSIIDSTTQSSYNLTPVTWHTP